MADDRLALVRYRPDGAPRHDWTNTERTDTPTRRPVQPAVTPAEHRCARDTQPERRCVPPAGSPARRRGRARPLSGSPAGPAASVERTRAGMPRAAVAAGRSRTGAGGPGPVLPLPVPTVVATPLPAAPGDPRGRGMLGVTAHDPGARTTKGRVRPAPLVAGAPGRSSPAG